MQLEQRQTLSQKLVLTQTMRQSLDCLQLSAPELTEYVQEVALSNPLLDVQSPTYYETELPSEAAPAEREPLEVRETDSWRGVASSGMEDVQDFTAFLTREKTFRDHLTEQIGQMKLVDDELLRLCRFLIDCLDERGYLDCPLEELSRELGMSSRYLRKTFEDSIGISCSQYITMLRIARAKELLWDWEKDITQVASLTGFNSPQYFCRIFKKHTGMTPAQYRNMKKERPELTEET